jgi:hypothetical protein
VSFANRGEQGDQHVHDLIESDTVTERRDNMLDSRRPGYTAHHERGQPDQGVGSHVQSRLFDIVGRRAGGGVQDSRTTSDDAFQP